MSAINKVRRSSLLRYCRLGRYGDIQYQPRPCVHHDGAPNPNVDAASVRFMYRTATPSCLFQSETAGMYRPTVGSGGLRGWGEEWTRARRSNPTF